MAALRYEERVTLAVAEAVDDLPFPTPLLPHHLLQLFRLAPLFLQTTTRQFTHLNLRRRSRFGKTYYLLQNAYSACIFVF